MLLASERRLRTFPLCMVRGDQYRYLNSELTRMLLNTAQNLVSILILLYSRYIMEEA